jgi:peptidoglycan/xylan/chitin deacetylase (PgdA/CDA1 family)
MTTGTVGEPSLGIVDQNQQRWGRGLGRGAARNEDLARTVALGGVPEQAGPFDETLPLHAAAQVAGAAQDAEGGHDGAMAADRSFDGALYGRFRPGQYEAGQDGAGHEGAGAPEGLQVPSPRGRRVSRRVLFAVAGLTLVGGGGVAAASGLSGSRSSKSPSAAPFGPGSPSATRSPSASAGTASASSSAAASGSPADLSSSSALALPTSSPDVVNTGGSANPGTVQSAPEYFVHAGPKVIALTLDDGPNNVYTPQVLALLQQYGIKATFCMVGSQVAANKSLVREVVAAGHTIVNHTWDHADQSKLTLAKVRSEISRANDALAAVDVHPSIFRAPYGAWSPTVFQACAAANLRPLDWSVDPRDWSRPGVNTIVSRIKAQTKTGSIILEHDGGGDRSQTVAALTIVLPELLAQGYRFTSV